MGLLPSGDLVDILASTHVFRLLDCNDPIVQSVAWCQLREVVRREIHRYPTEEDCATSGSGSLEDDFSQQPSNFSLFTKVRVASRCLKRLTNLRWHWYTALWEFPLTIGVEEDVMVPLRAIAVLERMTLKNAAATWLHRKYESKAASKRRMVGAGN
ncbi:hypothetical protein J437_LFUL004173 [Ladona fulva]|uniref:Uncharacterized protein n=1 Tax=Ladona fulva TaxID=123851 RepID=A0A8K0NV02_LADFU|nr:hypothetical protein J437_LFUL004173 [Ladona fulva]